LSVSSVSYIKTSNKVLINKYLQGYEAKIVKNEGLFYQDLA